ncbi:MAG: N-6 DNA methylase [Candidatus Zixiibacteriota bacterium]
MGEYYTPDWIADLALEAIEYKGGSILDPACGSGTFLMAAIRFLRSKGLRGSRLATQVLDSVLGIDVHPLAVMMTKANIALALAGEIKGLEREVYLPVYMADTLLVSEDPQKRAVGISVSEAESFHIPLETMSRTGNLDRLIDKLALVAERSAHSEEAMRSGWKGFERSALKGCSDHEVFLWRQNFKLYAKLLKQKRDTIWTFVLKNAYRPAYIRKRKVDYVVGNPPWLSYRYVKDTNYRRVIKDLTFTLGLLDRASVKLLTQMDTSTLFFAYSELNFLKPGGVIAFVLPKTTILPAKQHLKFQMRGMSEVHDFSDVTPLFNVRSVLIIREGLESKTKGIPVVRYSGQLPTKNMPLASARASLTAAKATLAFSTNDVRPSPYYSRFLQGATIVPRCLWFVQPDKEAAQHKEIPFLETSDEAFEEAKDQWRKRIEGRVEKRFLFETVLAKGLLPFALVRREMVFLPIVKAKRSFSLADSTALAERGFQHAADWMSKTEKLWEEGRQSDDRSLLDWLNYNQKLANQDIDAPLVVLYNTSGTNLTAALHDSATTKGKLSVSPSFVADAKTYYYYPKGIDEADYLCAVLNSDVVNGMIKEYQPQGLYGERDIHRRPFEVCAIPEYDSKDKVHLHLVELGKKCREDIVPFVPNLSGRLGQVRLDVRKILKSDISRINKLVRKLLSAAGQKVTDDFIGAGSVKNGELFGKGE